MIRVAIDSEVGQIFAADLAGIRAFNFMGELLDWGKTRDGEQPRYCGGLALHTGSPRLLYISDRVSHQVKAFDSDGKRVCKWGRHGLRDGEFFGAPKCVVVGVNGLIFVSDSAQVLAFPDGTFVFSLVMHDVKSMVQMASGAIVCAVDRRLIVF